MEDLQLEGDTWALVPIVAALSSDPARRTPLLPQLINLWVKLIYERVDVPNAAERPQRLFQLHQMLWKFVQERQYVSLDGARPRAGDVLKEPKFTWDSRRNFTYTPAFPVRHPRGYSRSQATHRRADPRLCILNEVSISTEILSSFVPTTDARRWLAVRFEKPVRQLPIAEWLGAMPPPPPELRVPPMVHVLGMNIALGVTTDPNLL